MGRWEREESDLNAVGPKTANSGSTGQTGRPYRSDRSGPICQQKSLVSVLIMPIYSNGRG